MKISFKWITNKSRERFAKIKVEHCITLQVVESFICKILSSVYVGDDGPEWERCTEIKSRATIDNAIRNALKWNGDYFADCWQDDVCPRRFQDPSEIVDTIIAKTAELIAAFYPEFAAEITFRKNLG